MGWGEPRVVSSTGTTAQIEAAHAALDEVNIPPGPLAERARKAALALSRHQESIASLKAPL